MARFAGLLLLPIYARHLGTGDVGRVGQIVALVAVGATIAQLGLVNALFRFAAEREGDARFAVARTAVGDLRGRRARARRSRRARHARRVAAPARRRPRGRSGSWPAAACSISLLYEPCAGLYRVEQRPQRFLAVTLVNVAVTVVVSVIWIVHFDGGALGLMAGSYTGTLVALLRRAVGPPRRAVRADRARARAARCCASACRSCPRAWRSGRSTSPTGCSWPGSRTGDARRRLRRRRERRLVDRAARDGLPAGLAAFRLRHQGRRRGAARLPLRAHASGCSSRSRRCCRSRSRGSG